MKTFMSVGVLVILVLAVGCSGSNVKLSDYDYAREDRVWKEHLFEKNFGADWPRTADERELLRPVVVEKMCSAWNELVGPRQKLAEVEAQVKELFGRLAPKDIMKRVELDNQVREARRAYCSLREPYQSLVESAYNAGFQREALVMPDNGLPSGDCW